MESSGNPLSSGHLIWKTIQGEKNNFASSNCAFNIFLKHDEHIACKHN
jgi:hypothetical protein